MKRRISALILAGFLLVAFPPAGMGSDHGASHGEGHGSSSHGHTMAAEPVATEDDHGMMHGDHATPGHSEEADMSHAPGDMDHEAAGHSAHDHEEMVKAAEAEAANLAARVRVDEKLGEYIDFSARFVDENNQPVDLKTLFDKPVVLLPVYFLCTSICNFLQAELANVLNFTDDIPGKDFNVITVSFSGDEDASHALTSKRNYANLVKRDIKLDNWYYLTGDRENILRLLDSMGYYFAKTKKHFYVHPNALIVLAKDGKIIRYLYGPDFLPFDVGMALSEARKGEPGISIKRGVLSFCFDYDPENKTYVFKMFRITGTAILALMVGFVLFLIRPSRKKKQRGLQHKPPET